GVRGRGAGRLAGVLAAYRTWRGAPAPVQRGRRAVGALPRGRSGALDTYEKDSRESGSQRRAAPASITTHSFILRPLRSKVVAVPSARSAAARSAGSLSTRPPRRSIAKILPFTRSASDPKPLPAAVR